MNILEKIVAVKQKEVEERKSLYPVKLLESSLYYSSPTVSLKKYLLRPDKSGIIAEIKRKSPSKGDINPYVSIERTSIGYMQAGACALSILTDKDFFGGSADDLKVARKFNFCPILRKDFIIDEYQIIEAKSIGADVILLIAAILTPQQVKQLAALATLVGVNNRNLKTFEVDINTSKRLSELMPKEVVAVSESGIDNPALIKELKTFGYKGFLIGETFMKNSRPELAAKEFIAQL